MANTASGRTRFTILPSHLADQPLSPRNFLTPQPEEVGGSNYVTAKSRLVTWMHITGIECATNFMSVGSEVQEWHARLCNGSSIDHPVFKRHRYLRRVTNFHGHLCVKVNWYWRIYELWWMMWVGPLWHGENRSKKIVSILVHSVFKEGNKPTSIILAKTV